MLYSGNIIVIHLHQSILTGPESIQMSKLISTYQAAPTAANRSKLQAYLNKHMMAACLATVEETEFLRVNGFSI